MFPPQHPTQPPMNAQYHSQPQYSDQNYAGYEHNNMANMSQSPPMPPAPPTDQFSAMHINHGPQMPQYSQLHQYPNQTQNDSQYTAATAPQSQQLYPPMPTSQLGMSGPPQMHAAPDAQVQYQNVGQAPTTPMAYYPKYPQGGQQYAPPMPPNYMNGPSASMDHGPPQPAKKVSAEALPSAVEVIESNRTQYSGPFQTGQRSVVPPLVTTDFSCRDEGNCNPRFIRSSLYAIPTSTDILKTVGVPFSVTISPFANLHTDDQPVIVSDMGEQGPVRCNRCRAYMNPFASFIDGGRRFQCPLCNGLTEVPESYFAHLDHTGRRADMYHRPELCLGSYELTATAEYCRNNELPNPPVFLFVLDVSQTSIRSGLVQLFCSQFVDHILPRLPRDEMDPDSAPPRIGFITYDHQLHFYSIGQVDHAVNGDSTTPHQPQAAYSMDYAKPQMHVVADVEDVFVPSVDGFLIAPNATGAITSLLQLIPTQFCTDATEPTPPDALLGPAIQAGLEALRAANCAGKLFVLHSNLPTAEAPGKLKNRDDRRLIGTEKEKTLLTPAGDFYTGLGQLCVEAGCSVDLFLFPNAFVDVVTLAEVPRLTAGHVYKYNCFQADLQGQQFLTDLQFAVARPKAFNAVMRLRTSAGIRPVRFFGNFHLPNTTDVELACADPDTGVTVEIRHDDKLQEQDTVFIQAACLFTSLSGRRKLRVHNLSLATTNSIPEIFRLIELDAHMNWLAKSAMSNLMQRAHPHVVDKMTGHTAHTLAAYRRHCSGTGPGESAASPSELILPQNMKLYPLYVQCLFKSDAFLPADNITIDERAWLIFLLNGMDVKQSSSFIYPRVYPAHNLELNPEGQLTYPPPAIRCSQEWLQPDGAYLLENGVNMFLWLGSNLPADWAQAVFKAPSLRHFEPEKVYNLPRLDTEMSRNLCHLIDVIHNEHARCTRLLVIRQGDSLEACFKRFLVEDRLSGNTASYVEFLCHIHKEVCSLLR